MDGLRPALTGGKGTGKQTAGGGGGWAGKAALVLSLLALAVSGAVLYLLLFGEKEPEYLTYREQQLLVLEGVDRNQYDPERFSVDSQGWLQYQSGGRRGVQGIDVSFYQGEIDWQAVADSGVEFAMIRVGYRGYSQGALQMDERFRENMDGALAPDWMWECTSFPRLPRCWRQKRRPILCCLLSGVIPSSTQWHLTGSLLTGRRPVPTEWTEIL